MALIKIDDFDPQQPYLHRSICFDPQSGSGATGHTGNINYMGFMVFITPRKFLSLCHDLPPEHMRDTADYFETVLPAQEWCIAPPQLSVTKNENGEWRVWGHEGRHRAHALQRIGMRLIPVFIFIQGMRARDFSEELLRSLKHLISEEGFPRVFNPRYIVVNKQAYINADTDEDLIRFSESWVKPTAIETLRQITPDPRNPEYNNYWSKPMPRYRYNPGKEDQLKFLEEDYFDQPAFMQKKDLVKINRLRDELGLPQVDADLQPLDHAAQPSFEAPSAAKVKRDPHVMARGLYEQYQEKLDELWPHQNYANMVIRNTRPVSGQTPVWAIATLGRNGGPLLCDICEKAIPLERGGYHMVPADEAWAQNTQGNNRDWYSYISGGVIFMQETNGTLRVYHGYADRSCHRKSVLEDERARKQFRSPPKPPNMERKLHAYLEEERGIGDIEERRKVINDLYVTLFRYDPGLGINRP